MAVEKSIPEKRSTKLERRGKNVVSRGAAKRESSGTFWKLMAPSEILEKNGS